MISEDRHCIWFFVCFLVCFHLPSASLLDLMTNGSTSLQTICLLSLIEVKQLHLIQEVLISLIY